MKTFSRYKKHESGQSLVEFALVLPILVMLIMGLIEFGWIFNGQITLTSAAREGARAAVVSEDIGSAADAATQAVLRHIQVSSVTVDEEDEDAVTVTEGVDGELLVNVQGSIEPIIRFFVRDTFSLNAEESMRQQFDIDFGEDDAD